ncbi:MAG: hypothetical protein E7541_01565, partial [Ruminococcaceae bacterium]|nr:hypothetical protein [Oscillospiraceae bacterium]
MLRVTGIAMPLSYKPEDLRRRAASLLGVPPRAVLTCTLAKRSIDARKKDNVHFEITVDVTVEEEETVLRSARCRRDKVSPIDRSPYVIPSLSTPPSQPPVVVGSGP